ncbi:MAG: hypothetical protein U0P81_03505 [Holophagaceae bacterium]
MRAPFTALALAAAMALPAAAQQARFIHVHIIGKSVHGHHGKRASQDGPTEVNMRMPIALAKSALEMAGDSEIKINGEARKGIKPDAMIKLLESSKAGDILLELTTDKGDVVKITLE